MKNANKFILFLIAVILYVVIVLFVADFQIAMKYKDAIIFGSGMLIMAGLMAIVFKD